MIHKGYTLYIHLPFRGMGDGGMGGADLEVA